MKRLLCVLLCLMLLCSFPCAAQSNDLDRQVEAFIYSHGLSEENFALSYYNSETGAKYEYNADAFFPVGEVWVLPLHMYYCSQEHDGAFLPAYDDPNFNNPDYEYTIAGMNLDTCRTECILRGNDELNVKMREQIRNYKATVNEALGHINEKLIPPSYYDDNSYSPRFLMNCLLELGRQPEVYSELMRLFAQAQSPEPGGFLSGEFTDTLRYPTIQLRSAERGMVCAVAQISAPDTYCLTAFVSEKAGGDAILAELNNLFVNYIETNSKNSAPIATTGVGFERSDETFKVSTKQRSMSGPIKMILIALAISAALAVVCYYGYVFYKRRRHNRRKKQYYDEHRK